MKPRVYLVLIAVSFLASGVAEGYMALLGRVLNEAAVAHLFVLAVLSFAWCKADVSARNIKEPSGSALLVGLIALVGVPLYFFRSRPTKDAALATARAVAFFVLCGALYIGGTRAGEAIGT